MGLKIFTSKIWKKYSPKISPLFSDAAGAHISDLWPYFHFLILLHLLYAQMGPFSFVEKNYVQGWNFHLKKIGCGTSDASDTSDASNTANSSDASKTGA